MHNFDAKFAYMLQNKRNSLFSQSAESLTNQFAVFIPRDPKKQLGNGKFDNQVNYKTLESPEFLKLSSKCEDHIFIWFQTPHFM